MSQPAIQYSPETHPLVLAVDDDRTLRMILVTMLEELDYSVLEAQNGKQELDTLLERTDEIDAIPPEREMPVIDGITLVSA